MEPGDEEELPVGSRGEYREYEAHVRDLIALSGRWDLFPELGIPRSTAESWIKKGYQSLDEKLSSFGNHYRLIEVSAALENPVVTVMLARDARATSAF